MDMGLKGQVAIVTGGATGLGLAIATSLAAEGVKIAVADINDATAERTITALNETTQAIFAPTDVRESQQVDGMVRLVLERFGRIDILINNAGIVGPQGPWVDLSDEGFDLVMGVNFKGAFLCAKYVLPHMIKQRSGKILNISSCAAKTGEEYNGVYSASKGAIWNFTQSLAKENGQFNINVNAICPAAMDTELMETVYRTRSAFFGMAPEELRKKIKSGYLLPRELTVKDAANLATFLVSERANMMTGQGVNVTAGVEMH
jgi:NAD(P)-dependent dehydrogenase (short-subunit alcohol dehydrogenase family)